MEPPPHKLSNDIDTQKIEEYGRIFFHCMNINKDTFISEVLFCAGFISDQWQKGYAYFNLIYILILKIEFLNS